MKKISRFIVLLFLVFPICSFAALGDDEELSFYELEADLMRTVTIATGVEQTTAQAPSVTSVITAADIEAIGARDLRQVLSTVPGFSVSYNQIGFLIFTIRGISSAGSAEVLMLLNGIRVNHVDTGRGGGANIPPLSTISRIEIIRGPGSAVYGADAFAGVVNIITKTADDIQGVEVGMQVGNFDTQNTWALYGGTWKGFEIMAALEYDTTDGSGGIVNSDKQTLIDRDFPEQYKASITPTRFDISKDGYDARVDVKKGNWQMRAGYRDRHIGTAGNATEALAKGSQLTPNRYNAELIYHNSKLTDYWDLTAQMSYLQMDVGYDLVIFPPGTSGPGQFPNGKILSVLYGERHSRFDISGFYSRFNKHLIRVGTGYIIDDQYDIQTYNNFAGGAVQNFTDTPDAAAPETNRDDWYVFLQDNWQISSELDFTAGVRYDRYSDFGETVNPRLALVWQPLPAFTSKLLFGSAFRAPTFDELYVNNNVTLMGNPNLKPETIETWELALSYIATETLHFSFNLFSFDIKDKILYPNAEDNPNVMFMAQNAGNWEGYGLEFETRWKMTNKSNLWFNYAFQNSEDKDTEQELGNSPTHQAYLRTDWLILPNWFLNGQLNWQADWSRQPNDPRDKIDASVTMNLNLRYKNISQNRWSFAVGIRNLFDEDVKSRSIGPDSDGRISMPNDYPLDRRSYWLEMRYHF